MRMTQPCPGTNQKHRSLPVVMLVVAGSLLASHMVLAGKPEEASPPIPEWEELSEGFRLIVESPRGVQRELLHGKYAADLSTPRMIADFLITFESAGKKRTTETDRLLSASVDIMKHKAAPEFAGPLMQIAESRLCAHPARAKALLSYCSLTQDNDYVLAKLKGDDLILRAAAQWAVAISEDQELLTKVMASSSSSDDLKAKGKSVASGQESEPEVGHLEIEDTVQQRAAAMFITLLPMLSVSETKELAIADKDDFAPLFADLRDLFLEHPEYVVDAVLSHGIVNPSVGQVAHLMAVKLGAEMQVHE